MGTGIGVSLAAAILAAACALPAAGQTVMLASPGSETRIAGREVSAMVRYARLEDDCYKVEARFFRPFDNDKLAEMTVDLKAGESFTYVPPLDDGPIFRFSRDDETVIVTIQRPSRLRMVRHGG